MLTRFGVREIACMEATMVLVWDYLPKGKKLDPIFEDMAVEGTISRWNVGNYDMIVAIRKDFKGFRLPISDEEQRQHSIKLWNGEYLPGRIRNFS